MSARLKMPVDGKLKCAKCGKMKPMADFPNRSANPSGKYSYCRTCKGRADMLDPNRSVRVLRHQPAVRARRKARGLPSTGAEHLRRLRATVLKLLGEKCACCGEIEPKFLAIDHVNNDGRKMRKEISYGKQLRMIRDGELPREAFRTLCHNCNCARGFYGACPHQVKS